MVVVRHPAVAGTFYPAAPLVLQTMVKKFLHGATQYANLPLPKAIIAPHAGYIYSGPIAASAYACLQHAKNKVKNVVILAPAHRYPICGLATTTADYYETPLGNVKINSDIVNKLFAFPFISRAEAAYDTEHALEVQLPFLQELLDDFALIPLLVGRATIGQVATILREVWNGNETLIVISSDLSHYHEYEKAQKVDNITAQAILTMNVATLDPEMACGYTAICGLLTVAAEKNGHISLVDLRNSGDTAGDKSQVVGYGAFHLT